MRPVSHTGRGHNLLPVSPLDLGNQALSWCTAPPCFRGPCTSPSLTSSFLWGWESASPRRHGPSSQSLCLPMFWGFWNPEFWIQTAGPAFSGLSSQGGPWYHNGATERRDQQRRMEIRWSRAALQCSLLCGRCPWHWTEPGVGMGPPCVQWFPLADVRCTPVHRMKLLRCLNMLTFVKYSAQRLVDCRHSTCFCSRMASVSN